MLLSNTSKRLRRVVTSVPIPAASSHQKCGNDDGLTEMTLDESTEMILDESMDYHADTVASSTDFEHPAAIRIWTRAKRYQNSVSWFMRILLLRAEDFF